MTAAYGLPDHLLDPVAHAVETAWRGSVAAGPDWAEEFDGSPLHTLKALWFVRIRDGVHEGLLKPDEARELLRVAEDGIEVNAARLTNVSDALFAPDFPAALGLDLRAEEILMTLIDIAYPLEATA